MFYDDDQKFSEKQLKQFSQLVRGAVHEALDEAFKEVDKELKLKPQCQSIPPADSTPREQKRSRVKNRKFQPQDEEK